MPQGRGGLLAPKRQNPLSQGLIVRAEIMRWCSECSTQAIVNINIGTCMFVLPEAQPYRIFWRISRSRIRAPAIRVRLVTNVRPPRPPPYCVPFDSPLTAGSLRRLAAALPQDLIDGENDSSSADTTEKAKSAAVLIALSNVDGQPGILLELRGKVRTHSGEIRCNSISGL
jgi:hypothetical protein